MSSRFVRGTCFTVSAWLAGYSSAAMASSAFVDKVYHPYVLPLGLPYKENSNGVLVLMNKTTTQTTIP
jgi:hypothetical protein